MEKIKPVTGGQRIEGWVEKLTDVALAVYMVSMAYENRYDVAVVISGDADLVPAMEIVSKIRTPRADDKIGKRKQIHVAAFTGQEPLHVKSMADTFEPLEYLIPGLLKCEKPPE